MKLYLTYLIHIYTDTVVCTIDSSMYKELEVRFLLTEDGHEKRNKNRSSPSSKSNERTMELVNDNPRVLCKWCIRCIVSTFYKCCVILLNTINWFTLTKSPFTTIEMRIKTDMLHTNKMMKL